MPVHVLCDHMLYMVFIIQVLDVMVQCEVGRCGIGHSQLDTFFSTFFFSVDCAAYLLYTARLNFNVVLHGLCNVDIMRLVLPVLMQLH